MSGLVGAWLALSVALGGPGQPQGEPALVVTTPGVAYEAYLPLLWALEGERLQPTPVRFSCRGQGADELVEEVAAAIAEMPPGTPVVAHGLGATLVLMARERAPDDARPVPLVLLAPVLGALPSAALDAVSQEPVGASMVLGGRGRAGRTELSELLLGRGHPPLACAPARFSAEVQAWIRAGEVPVDLSRIEDPVWIGVSQGDDVATLETVVPRSRELAGPRELVRMGLARWDCVDFEHGQMLEHPVPVRRAARGARVRVRPRWSR